MGKLLHKLMHGIVPSWITKIKASDAASPKKLLPFLRGGAHFFSNKSSAMSSSSPRSATNTELLALMDTDHNSYYSQSEDEKEPSTEANMESCATPTPSSKKAAKSIMNDDGDHHHQQHQHQHQHHDGYHPQHLDDDQRRYHHDHELQRSKRKSQCLHEEGEQDHGSSSMRRWPFKRRQIEKGVMISELPESICEMVGNGSAVVKYSDDPHLAFWESMVEMIVGNGLWDLGNLEFLLYCYLSLNDPNLHDTIQISFLQVLKDLERTC